MNKFTIILFFVSLAIIFSSNVQGAFADTGPKRLVIVSTDEKSRRRPAVIVAFSPYRSGNTISRMTIEFNLKPNARRSKPRIGITKADRTELLEALQAGANADKTVLQKFAIYFARNTYCRSGPIKLNRKGRSFSGAANIRAITNANNGKILGGKIPSGISGTPIPPIEFLPQYAQPTWQVRLFCNSPWPY